MKDSIEHMFGQRNGRAERFDVAYRVAAARRDPAELWALLASPAQWSRWAPHIRGATSTVGATTVTAGDTVRIEGWGPLRVTTTITRVDPGSRWDFSVDLPAGHRLVATHEVATEPPAVQVRMALRGPAPRPVGVTLLAAYRPLAVLALHRLVSLGGERP